MRGKGSGTHREELCTHLVGPAIQYERSSTSCKESFQARYDSRSIESSAPWFQDKSSKFSFWVSFQARLVRATDISLH